MSRTVVYTDLDGTLLDHHNYSWQPAAGMLQQLRERDIPVVPCTSKTRAELLALRSDIGLTGPFIVENGAAVIMPGDTPDEAEVQHFVAPRAHWLSLINQAYAAVGRVARGFSEMDPHELVALTGLSPEAAHLAAQREYGEPLQWLVPPEERLGFLDFIAERGGVVLQGGRFAHVSGASDKGQALNWLQSRFAGQWGHQPLSIAAGDSHNDVAMLEAADWALLVRSPSHQSPALTRRERVLLSDAYGPAGWAEGLAKILAKTEG